jgi:hypothetical protein
MSSVSNGAWGLLSVIAICTTAGYVKWKADQEEARLCFHFDQRWQKLIQRWDQVLENIDQGKKETDELLKRLNNTVEKINDRQNWKNY